MSVLGNTAAGSMSGSDWAAVEARSQTLTPAAARNWVSLVTCQHRQLENALACAKAALSRNERRAAHRWVEVLLGGHAMAESSVLYPALAALPESAATEPEPAELATAQGEMAALEMLEPLSKAYFDKLEQVRSVAVRHMDDAGNAWFAVHQALPASEHAELTHRYQEEFERYVGQA